MFAAFIFVVGATFAIPVPQLTFDEFWAASRPRARGRSLDSPKVSFSQSYRQVRMQGRNQAEDSIQFSTSVARDPRHLTRVGSRKGSISAGPTYIPVLNYLSTKDIEEKIKEINAATEKKIDEENEKRRKEIEALTDKLAEQIFLEELEEKIVQEALIADISSAVDFNFLDTNDFVTESNVMEEKLLEDKDIFENNEGSGNVSVNVDFGDIQEIVTEDNKALIEKVAEEIVAEDSENLTDNTAEIVLEDLNEETLAADLSSEKVLETDEGSGRGEQRIAKDVS